MSRRHSLWRVALAVMVLALAGCDTKEESPPVEASFEDLNLALAKIDKDGDPLPASVEELLALPELKGKVLPEAPPGFHLVIDRENKKITVQIDDVLKPEQ